MRTITVTFNDGTTHVYQNAPDEVTPEAIQARAQQEFGKNVTAMDGGRKASAAPPMRGVSGGWGAGASGSWEPQSTGDRFKRGFMQDPIEGLQGLAAETETARLIAPGWANNKRAELQQKENNYQSNRAAAGETGIDWPRLGGQITNPVNLGIAALTKTPPGASLPTRIAAGALGGGMMSGVAPVYGDATRTGQTLAGMAGGALAAPLTGGAARVIKPKVDPNLALLRKEGVVPTMGQSMGGAWKSAEDKAMSLPVLGDAITSARRQGMDKFQIAAYNRALKPIGEKASGKVGFVGNQEVHQKLSSAFDEVLPKLSFKPDAQFTSGMSNVDTGIKALDKGSQGLYKNIINRIMGRATPQGNMSGETFKNVGTSLNDEVMQLRRDGGYEKGKIADALEEVKSLMDDGLERSNPALAPRLQKIREGWANYAIVRDAGSGVQAAKNEGMFTPAQLAQGVQAGAKRQGKAIGKGKLSEGRALMQDLTNAGQQVLPSQYPDSGTAGRLLQSAVLGTAAAGQMPFTLGTLGGLAGASIPYLPGARKAADVMLNARPNYEAEAVAELIKRYPGLLSPVAPSLVNGFNNK